MGAIMQVIKQSNKMTAIGFNIAVQDIVGESSACRLPSVKPDLKGHYALPYRRREDGLLDSILSS